MAEHLPFYRVCLLGLFKAVCSILVLLPSNFFSSCFARVQVVQPYNSTDMAAALMNTISF